MRSIGMIGSLAALLASSPLAAQGKLFRTDDVIQSAQRATSSTTPSSHSKEKIPRGQLPPAGMCRIWIDGVPPGRQPAPTDCQTAVASKPANARVIWGDQTPFPGKGKDADKTKRGGPDVDDDDDDADDDKSGRAKKSDRGDDDDKKLKNKGKKHGHGRGGRDRGNR
jgi:hypothetical protein